MTKYLLRLVLSPPVALPNKTRRIKLIPCHIFHPRRQLKSNKHLALFLKVTQASPMISGYENKNEFIRYIVFDAVETFVDAALRPLSIHFFCPSSLYEKKGEKREGGGRETRMFTETGDYSEECEFIEKIYDVRWVTNEVLRHARFRLRLRLRRWKR